MREEVVKRALEALAQVCQGPVRQVTPTRPRNRSEDSYVDRMEVAIRKICRPDYPTGMIGWLREHVPALYEELMERLRDQIDRLWDAHAPLDEFQRVLDAWVAAHEHSCRLYREYLNKQTRDSDNEGFAG